MKRALVTGASGFVGGYLVRHLSRLSGITVGAILRKPSDSLNGISKRLQVFQVDLNRSKDVCQLVKKFKPDQIYHLAASSSSIASFEDPIHTIQSNIGLQMPLLEAARSLKSRPRVLIASSSEVYGKMNSGKKIDETHPLNPYSPYGISKMAQEMIAFHFGRIYGIPVLVARSFNHLGPGQTNQRVVSSFAYQVACMERGFTERVLRVGNIRPARDFTDVRDVVRAYELIVAKGVAGQVYHVCSGRPQAISAIIALLKKVSKVPFQTRLDSSRLRTGDVERMAGSYLKLKRHTGWAPKISIEQSIQDLLEDWRRQVAFKRAG